MKFIVYESAAYAFETHEDESREDAFQRAYETIRAGNAGSTRRSFLPVWADGGGNDITIEGLWVSGK